MPTPVNSRLKLRLAPAAEAAVRGGHPWVFDRAIRSQSRDGEAGELAVVYDRRDHFLAIGLYDPASPIRVRILHVGNPVNIDSTWWQARLQSALARRAGHFDTPPDGPPIGVPSALPARPLTDGYRLINGESDGWPGLVLDRYAETLVLKIYTAAWWSRIDEVVGLLRDALPWATALVLRLSRNLSDPSTHHRRPAEGFLFSVAQPPAESVVFRENGLRFEAEVRHGQKTGFFLDQRDNRARVESMAAGRDALNAFSFSGGFSLYAARGGARSVTDLDISEHALASSRRNFALNTSEFPTLAACAHRTIQADAFTWLGQPPRETYDLIIVDPPSLARRQSERPRALEAYARLHTSAITRLRHGGILVAASCSAHIDQETFFATVRRAVRSTGRSLRELWSSSHPPDHSATIPEAHYLKCLAVEISG